MRIVFLLIFIGCMAVVALSGCDAHEERGVAIAWSKG